jgi:hypothetical protein
VNKSFGCVDAWGRSNPSLARPSAASLVLHRTKPPPLLASIHPARSERKPRHDTVAGRCATHKSPQPTNPIRASPGGGRAGGGHGMCGRPRHAHYSDASLAGKRREPSPSEARPLLPCPCRPIELAAGLPAAGAGAVAVAVAARHRRRARGWGGLGLGLLGCVRRPVHGLCCRAGWRMLRWREPERGVRRQFAQRLGRGGPSGAAGRRPTRVDGPRSWRQVGGLPQPHSLLKSG